MKTQEKSETQQSTKEEPLIIETCPLCKSPMEKGFVATSALSWSDKKISSWSFKGLYSGEMIVSRGYPYLFENVEAFRCRKCRLVIFRYGERGRE